MAFSLGIYLTTKQNSLFTTLAILKSLREDSAMGPVDKRITDEDDKSEVALRSVHSCLLICGAISLVLSLLIVVNLYCFLALILAPGSAVMGMLPGLQAIRTKMGAELSGAGVAAPPPPPSLAGGSTPPAAASEAGSVGTPMSQGSVPGSTGTPASAT